MNPITITIPIPPPELSPNSRAHWAARAREKAMQRMDARHACLDAINRQRLPVPFAAVTVQPVFFYSTSRRRDRDNAGAMLKAAYDGLVDAGLLADDETLTPLAAELRADKGNPRVELIITAEVDAVLTERQGPQGLGKPED